MRSKTPYGLTALVAIAVIWCGSIVRPPDHALKVISEIGGRISSIHVQESDYVHTGDVLIQLDTRSLLLKKHSLESRIHFTELQLFRAGLAGLYQDLEQTNLDLTLLTITSPADGQIASLTTLHSGDILSPGATVATVVAASHSVMIESGQ